MEPRHKGKTGAVAAGLPRRTVDVVADLQTRASSSFDAASGSSRHQGSAAVRTGAGRPGAKSSRGGAGRGAKPKPLEWHHGDKVRVRAERIDPMRKRVEFALLAQP